MQDLSRSDYAGGWSRLFYTANSATKFTYTTSSYDDGFANVPSAASGTVTQTNGGSSSILIVTNAKSGYTAKAYQRVSTIMRTSFKVFFVDRKIGDLVSSPTSVSLNPATSWVEATPITNYECQPYSGSAALQTLTQQLLKLFYPATVTSADVLSSLSVTVDSVTLRSATNTNCGASTQLSAYQFDVFEAGTTVKSLTSINWATGKIDFAFVPTLATL